MIGIFFAGQMFIFIGDSGNFGKMVILAKFYDGNGFAELLNLSHIIAPEVMYLKNGGFLAGFWLTGYDLKSSTVQELEHLSEMMALAIGQVDVSCCIHFEFFRGEDHNYPSAIFMRLLQNLPTQNVLLSFSRKRGILNLLRRFSLLTFFDYKTTRCS